MTTQKTGTSVPPFCSKCVAQFRNVKWITDAKNFFDYIDSLRKSRVGGKTLDGECLCEDCMLESYGYTEEVEEEETDCDKCNLLSNDFPYCQICRECDSELCRRCWGKNGNECAECGCPNTNCESCRKNDFTNNIFICSEECLKDYTDAISDFTKINTSFKL